MLNKYSYFNNKVLDILIAGLASTGLLIFMGTSFNSFFWMDDFWKRLEILQVGLLRFQWDIYWNWDGRAISPVYLLRDIVLWMFDYQFAWAAILISMFFLIGTAFFIFKILVQDNIKEITLLYRWIFTLLITFILVMVFRPHLSRSLYWVTGSYYTLSNFFTVFIVYRLIRYPKSSMNLFWLFVAVSSGPNNGVLIIAFLILGHFSKILKIETKRFYTLTALGVITLFFVVMSPGNFSRADGIMDFSPIGMITGGISILKEYLGMSLWILPGSLIIATGLGSYLTNQRFTLFIVLVCCALSSILPFLPVSGSASKHTAIFFQTFLLIALIYGWTFFFQLMKVKFIYILTKLSLFLFLLFFSYQIWIQLITGAEVKKSIDQRFQVLETNRGRDIELKLEPVQIPDKNWVSRFWDIDPRYASNVYYERYYSIKKVTIQIDNHYLRKP